MLLGARLGPLLGTAAGAMKETDAGWGREAEEARTGCTGADMLPLLLRLLLQLRCLLAGAGEAAGAVADAGAAG